MADFAARLPSNLQLTVVRCVMEEEIPQEGFDQTTREMAVFKLGLSAEGRFPDGLDTRVHFCERGHRDRTQLDRGKQRPGAG